MDALALLCTLHAEGPATLRQLRESGVRTLADLERAEAETLSQLLDLSAAAARRFLREAAALGVRVVEEPPTLAAGLDTGLPADLESAAGTPLAAGDIDLLSKRDRRLVDRVLDRWREEERSSPAESSAPEPRREGLEVGAIDGLTGEVCARLEHAGIETLDALAQLDPLAVAGQTGLGFSTLRRLQYLAAKAPRETGSETRLSLADRPSFESPRGAVRAWELSPEEAPGNVRGNTGGSAPGDCDASAQGATSRPTAPDRDEGVGGPFAQG